MTKESLKKQNDALKLRVKKLQLENSKYYDELKAKNKELYDKHKHKTLKQLFDEDVEVVLDDGIRPKISLKAVCINECSEMQIDKLPKEFWERNHTQTKDIEIKYLGDKV